MENVQNFTFFIVLCTILISQVFGGVVQYDLTASYQSCNPDGYLRQCIVVNGMFPGPTLHAKLGDTLVVRVKNLIRSPQPQVGIQNTSVHWHGLEMLGYPWFDGPEGVTQCTIPYGETMEYRFKLYQAGTYWYHSHHSWQYVEGFWGILNIANSPAEVYGNDYDIADDFSIALSDWHHDSSYDLSQRFHVNDTQIPIPKSALINGRGIYPCNDLECNPRSDKPFQEFQVFPGKTYRIRVINTSARARFNFSIDCHKLSTIEVDGVDTYQVEPVDQVEIWPAQRYSFLVRMDQTLPDAFWIRADVTGLVPAVAHPSKAKAILRYEREICSTNLGVANLNFGSQNVEDNTIQTRRKREKSIGHQGRPAKHDIDWDQLKKEAKTVEGKKRVQETLFGASNLTLEPTFTATTLSARSSKSLQLMVASVSLPMTMPPAYPKILDASTCRPREDGTSASAPNYFNQEFILQADFHQFDNPPENYAFINHISYSSLQNPPVIVRLIKQMEIANSTNPQYIPLLKRVVQVVINNNDFEGHPWHLHGHTFWVLGNGEPGTEDNKNLYNPAKHEKLLNINGVRRDTTHTHPYSWTVIRFEADNPGAWLLHCHINWHLEVGLGAVFIEGQDELRELYVIPEEARRMCALNGISI